MNDLEGIKQLYEHLKSGVYNDSIAEEEVYEIRKLQFEINRLKIKLDFIENKIQKIQKSDIYLTAKNIKNKDEYFEYLQIKIKREIEELKLKYGKEFASNKKL